MMAHYSTNMTYDEAADFLVGVRFSTTKQASFSKSANISEWFKGLTTTQQGALLGALGGGGIGLVSNLTKDEDEEKNYLTDALIGALGGGVAGGGLGMGYQALVDMANRNAARQAASDALGGVDLGDANAVMNAVTANPDILKQRITGPDGKDISVGEFLTTNRDIQGALLEGQVPESPGVARQIADKGLEVLNLYNPTQVVTDPGVGTAIQSASAVPAAVTGTNLAAQAIRNRRQGVPTLSMAPDDLDTVRNFTGLDSSKKPTIDADPTSWPARNAAGRDALDQYLERHRDRFLKATGPGSATRSPIVQYFQGGDDLRVNRDFYKYLQKNPEELADLQKFMNQINQMDDFKSKLPALSSSDASPFRYQSPIYKDPNSRMGFGLQSPVRRTGSGGVQLEDAAKGRAKQNRNFGSTLDAPDGKWSGKAKALKKGWPALLPLLTGTGRFMFGGDDEPKPDTAKYDELLAPYRK